MTGREPGGWSTESGSGAPPVTGLPHHALRLFRPPAVHRHVEGEDPYGTLLEPTPTWIRRTFWLVVTLAAAAAGAAALWWT